MQACDRNGIENSASSTFTADFMPTATSPWLPIVGFPGCSRPCLSAASTVADEALSFGWLAYLPHFRQGLDGLPILVGDHGHALRHPHDQSDARHDLGL